MLSQYHVGDKVEVYEDSYPSGGKWITAEVVQVNVNHLIAIGPDGVRYYRTDYDVRPVAYINNRLGRRRAGR